MSLAIEITPEQSEASRIWVNEFYKAFDSFNLDYWLSKFYKPDTILNLCNNPTMAGCEQIRAHFEHQQPLLKSMKHDLKQIDVLPDRIYVQNEATFIVKNDPNQTEIKMRAVCVLWKNINEEQVSSIDVYFDPTPLMDVMKAFL